MTYPIAIVRAPSPALTRCELSFVPRTPIDVDLAAAQHRAYAAALEGIGVRLVRLPPEPELPDAAFVEDTAVVLDEIAVIANPGAESRRGEVASVARALEPFRPRVYILGAATLDGGDVLRVGRMLYVGRTRRTNEAGIEQLRERVAPLGYEVRPVAVQQVLHLKSACASAGGDAVLLSRAHVDPSPFDGLEVLDLPTTELGGANTVIVGDAVLLAQGFPETAELLARRGRDVHVVDISEFRKAEGGVSCLSLIFEEG